MKIIAPLLLLAFTVYYTTRVGYRALAGYPTWMRQKFAREGRCITCGYDMRKSLLRCPECGNEVDGAKRAFFASFPPCTFFRYVLDPVWRVRESRRAYTRYTDRCRLVMMRANRAADPGNGLILPVHLLAAMAVDPDCNAAKILQWAGVDLVNLAKRLPVGDVNPVAGPPRKSLHWTTHRAIHQASIEATGIGEDFVDTEHLLLALFHVPAQYRDEIFQQPGVNYHRALECLIAGRANAQYVDGDIAGALSRFDSLNMQPSPELLCFKAHVLACSEDPKFFRPGEARDLAKKACELTSYGMNNALASLAHCEATCGNYTESIRLLNLMDKQMLSEKGRTHAEQLLAYCNNAIRTSTDTLTAPSHPSPAPPPPRPSG